MVRLLSILIGSLSIGAGLALAYFDLFSIGSLAPRQENQFPQQRMWSAGYFTNTPVVTHDDKKLRFYEDLIKDKIVVVNFIYTSCRDVCSLATARLAQVRQMLGDRVGRDIFFYSITLDPAVDGPEVLKKYAANFYTGPGWLFLTGTPDNIEVIRHKLGERTKSLSDHRNDVLLGNDATGEWGRIRFFQMPNISRTTFCAWTRESAKRRRPRLQARARTAHRARWAMSPVAHCSSKPVQHAIGLVTAITSARISRV